MKRSRPGSPASRRSRRPRDADGSALRKVPPTSRRGVNSQQSDRVRHERTRARRTGLVRRAFALLRNLILGSVVTGGLGVAGWAGWRAFENNGFLALRQVDVVGNNLVDKARILERAGLELGIKLPSVRVGSVESSLRSLPGVGEAEVRRIFPSRIEIRIKEKEPVAMGYARGWYGLAPDGSRIGGVDWGQSDLPVVDGFAGLDSVSRAALGAFLDGAKRQRPALYANFSQLAWRGTDGMEIILRDGRLKVLVGLDLPLRPSTASPNPLIAMEKATNRASDQALNSLEFLQVLIDQHGASIDAGRTVDLRVHGYAYVR